MLGDADISVMLRDCGVPVSFIYSGYQQDSYGVVDTRDEDLLVGEAAHFGGKLIAVVVKTGSLLGLAERATLTVDGTDYTVVSARQQDDGQLTRVLCTPQ